MAQFIRSGTFLVLFLTLVLLSGCGSDNEGFVNNSQGGAAGLPSSLEENLHGLAKDIGKSGISTLAREGRRDRQINETVDGPKGGRLLITGDLNFGPDEANPATSTLNALFQSFTFYDGLVLNGGSATLETRLWGTEEAAQGSLTLTAENVTFSGVGSGVHSFTVEFDLVNSKVVRTILTLDGKRQELGFILNLVNKSQNADSDVFITIIGKDAAATKWHYLAGPDDTQMTEFDDTPGSFLNKVNGVFEGGEKYSITLSDMTPVAEHTYRLIVPRENLVSGRIYFAFGQKLQGVGINAPYYNQSGVPVTSSTTATGSLTSGQADVTLSGSIDATRDLGLNEPVSYQDGASTKQAKVVDILSPTSIKIDPAPTSTLASVTLNFTPDPDAIAGAKLNLSGPSPTGPPDYLTTFDLVELSATTNPQADDPFYTLFANTTAIDFFSVGIGMTVDFAGLPPGSNVAPSKQTVGFGATAEQILAGETQRDAIIDRFNNTGGPNPATPAEFQAFVTASPDPNAPAAGINSTGDPHITMLKPVNKDLQVIRVLGPPPIVALLPTGDMSKYLASTISAEWAPFCMNVVGLTIDFPSTEDRSFTYQGTSNSSTTLNLQCTFAVGSNTGQDEQYMLPAPTTRIIWECDDTDNPGPLPNNYQNAGTDAHRRLGSIVSAAFARGVFAGGLDDWRDNTKFYTRADRRYNFFSKVMHDFALNKIVYGFAYDDVFGQDSTLAGPIGLTSAGKVPQSDNGNVVDVTLTIPNFKAPPPPAKPGAPLIIQAVQSCGDPASFDGCVAHLTPESGGDVALALDPTTGKATLSGLDANVTYTAWISPGPDWYFSYAAKGKYDGTTDNWNSSFGAVENGVIKLQIGRLVPGTGSCLSPQPNALDAGATAPLPTTGSGQSNWGNLAP